MKEFNYRKYKDIKWDNEIISLLTRIYEYKGRQELYLNQKPSVLEKLVEIAKIQSVETSNKIEGIRTSQSRMGKLLSDKTSPKNRDEEEILGYRDVLNTIHENYEYISLNSNHILQLHRDLYKYSGSSIGGKYKNVQNEVQEELLTGEKIVRFMTLAPFETPFAIDSICENFNFEIEKNDVDALILIPVFIHDFLCIHPFNDGNGRMSRLLTTLLLYKNGYAVGKYISLESKIEKNKSKYYSTLEKSGRGWHDGDEDVSPFIKYILGIIISAYKDFEDRVDYIDNKMSAVDQVKNVIDKTLGKINKKDLVEKCPNISVKSIERALKILLDDAYIIKKGKGRATFYIKADKWK